MKQIVLILSALTILLPAYAQIPAGVHPRLILSDDELVEIRQQVASDPESPVATIHKAIIASADGLIPQKPLTYKKDKSGKRILGVSRSAAQIISYCAYAYRFTGDEKYLDKAIFTMRTVCEFPDWNSRHFLDVAEMASGVGIGYDWLYSELSPEMRKLIEVKLKEYAFDTMDGTNHENIWKLMNNRNQVNLSGLVCAALAVSDAYPEMAKDICGRAVKSNLDVVKYLYNPDGAYPEGPGYWSYGTCYQVWMNTLLKDNLGSDFGLGEVPGFKKTPWFEAFATGSSGKQFNFGDCREPGIAHYPYWYFAYTQNDSSIIYPELEYMKTHDYSDSQQRALIFIALKFASKIKLQDVQQSSNRLFVSKGITPLAIGRNGWGCDDLWFAVKGGKASASHAHMDAGEFLFDSNGVRWSKDVFFYRYEIVENPLKALGGSYWDQSQKSLRWKISRVNCRWHSCLIFDDRDLLVDGFATLEDSYDNDDFIGAKFNLSPLYNDINEVTRTVAIKDNEYLEVSDHIVSDKPHTVRFNLVSEAEPKLVKDGIILQKDGRLMKLQTSVRGAKYKIWTSDPSDFSSFPFEKQASDTFICGFEVKTKKNCNQTFVTTIKKEN